MTYVRKHKQAQWEQSQFQPCIKVQQRQLICILIRELLINIYRWHNLLCADAFFKCLFYSRSFLKGFTLSGSLTFVTPHSFTSTRLESLWSKLEQLADEFIRARKELEEIFSSRTSFSVSTIGIKCLRHILRVKDEQMMVFYYILNINFWKWLEIILILKVFPILGAIFTFSTPLLAPRRPLLFLFH